MLVLHMLPPSAITSGNMASYEYQSIKQAVYNTTPIFRYGLQTIIHYSSIHR
jgi:hypothetical protein